jgi:hypothetical protein
MVCVCVCMCIYIYIHTPSLLQRENYFAESFALNIIDRRQGNEEVPSPVCNILAKRIIALTLMNQPRWFPNVKAEVTRCSRTEPARDRN